jgi:hypothetical protein
MNNNNIYKGYDMAGILSALGQVSNILYETNENGLTGKALLDALQSKDVQLMRADGSMLKLLNNFIVEPVCVVSKNLKDDEIIDKVLGLHTDMFTGFYMQAYSVLTSIYGKDTSVSIDVLGTDNGGLERVFLRGASIALEDRDFLGELMHEDFNLSTEKVSNDQHNSQYVDQSVIDNSTYNTETKSSGGGKANSIVGTHEGFKDLYIPNAIQRTIEVTITTPGVDSNGNRGASATTITVPVTIKTHVIYTDIDNIINVLKPNSDDKGFFNRIDEYRAGAISMADLVFTGDIIKQYKENKLKDSDKLLELIQARKLSANSKMADKQSPFPGFEKYYNMYIITAEDKIVIEKHLKGKLSKAKYKQKFLDQAYGLSITDMDQDYERVQMMMRDIRGTTDLTYKTVSKTDKNGSDTDELVKALMANKPPVF